MINISKSGRIYFVVLVSLCCVQAGCKKAGWYDEKPSKSLAVPTTLTDMQALMDNAETLNQYTPALGEAACDDHFVPDGTFQIMDILSINAYTWSHSQPYTQIFEWNYQGAYGAFSRVYYCNIVLEGLQNIHPATPSDQQQWNNIQAQALFHRARSFYEVSQVFAPPFVDSSASTDQGVPLRLQSDINLPSVRSTIRQTYDQVLGDLIKAGDLLPANGLPVTPLEKTRPAKAAVFGLLARIYLSMENYSEAGLYADSCLQLYSTLMDYNTLDTTSSSPIAIFNPEVILHTTTSDQFIPASIYYLLIDTSFYHLYANDDLRRKIFFDSSSANGITFIGTYDGGIIGELFSGLASDEMYLIRAEASARQGNTALAMQDLNTLLRTRWNNSVPFPTFTAVDADDALRQILIERRKELVCRGLRWSDLRRLNHDDRFKVTLTRTAGGNTYTLEPNSYKYTFPIPDDIIAVSGMKQNAGW